MKVAQRSPRGRPPHPILRPCREHLDLAWTCSLCEELRAHDHNKSRRFDRSCFINMAAPPPPPNVLCLPLHLADVASQWKWRQRAKHLAWRTTFGRGGGGGGPCSAALSAPFTAPAVVFTRTVSPSCSEGQRHRATAAVPREAPAVVGWTSQSEPVSVSACVSETPSQCLWVQIR